MPLRFLDGFTATAEVLTFHGPDDEREHLLLAPGKGEQAYYGPIPAAPTEFLLTCPPKAHNVVFVACIEAVPAGHGRRR